MLYRAFQTCRADNNHPPSSIVDSFSTLICIMFAQCCGILRFRWCHATEKMPWRTEYNPSPSSGTVCGSTGEVSGLGETNAVTISSNAGDWESCDRAFRSSDIILLHSCAFGAVHKASLQGIVTFISHTLMTP